MTLSFSINEFREKMDTIMETETTAFKISNNENFFDCAKSRMARTPMVNIEFQELTYTVPGTSRRSG